MKPCPQCGLEDYCHNCLKCELWPGVDGEWYRTIANESETREPRIGYWWTTCCELDLEEIKSAMDVASVAFQREYGDARVWPTKEEALEELELAEGLWESEVVHE